MGIILNYFNKLKRASTMNATTNQIPPAPCAITLTSTPSCYTLRTIDKASDHPHCLATYILNDNIVCSIWLAGVLTLDVEIFSHNTTQVLPNWYEIAQVVTDYFIESQGSKRVYAPSNLVHFSTERATVTLVRTR